MSFSFGSFLAEGGAHGVVSTDTDDATTTSSVSPASATSSLSPLPTSPGTQRTSSRQNTAAIVGGTVGGVSALVLVTASLLCYWRYKRRRDSRLPWSEERPVLGSLHSLHESFEGTSLPTYQTRPPLSEV